MKNRPFHLALIAALTLGSSLSFAQPAAEAPPRPFLRKVIKFDDIQTGIRESLKLARERLAAAH